MGHSQFNCPHGLNACMSHAQCMNRTQHELGQQGAATMASAADAEKARRVEAGIWSVDAQAWKKRALEAEAEAERLRAENADLTERLSTRVHQVHGLQNAMRGFGTRPVANLAILRQEQSADRMGTRQHQAICASTTLDDSPRALDSVVELIKEAGPTTVLKACSSACGKRLRN